MTDRREVTDEAVEKDFREFWATYTPILNEDGSLNEEQVKKELYDYHLFMDDASRVYVDITNGRISKPNTRSDVVLGEAQAVTQDEIEWAVEEEVKARTDELRARVEKLEGALRNVEEFTHGGLLARDMGLYLEDIQAIAQAALSSEAKGEEGK